MATIDFGNQNIYYSEAGAGETLLLFPDNLHASSAYENDIANWAERYHVISFDYPGIGKSTREVKYQDERDHDLWNYHADLACHILQYLQVDACYVTGSGFGAWSALHFAGKQAALHHITPLGVIADSFLYDMDTRTLHRALDKREHYYTRRIEWLEMQHGVDWRQVVDADTAFMRRIADHGGYTLSPGLLNAISCPTLLTGSLNDDVMPDIAAHYAKMVRWIPKCDLYLIHSANHRYGDEHPLIWANPDLFRGICRLFLAKV